MATTSLPRAATHGGSFLVDACLPEDVFTPADLTDDQKLIGRTAEEFRVIDPELLEHRGRHALVSGRIEVQAVGVPEPPVGERLDRLEIDD